MERLASRCPRLGHALHGAWTVVRDAGRGWDQDNALRLGAALSFYALLAMPPILVIALWLAGRIFGRSLAEEGVLRQLAELLGADGSRVFAEMLQTASKPSEGLLAAGLGLLVLLFGATGVFVELRDALNLIWKVPAAGGLLRGLLKGRLLAFNIVMATGLLLIVSLFVSTLTAVLAVSLGPRVSGLDAVLRRLDLVLSFAVLATLFALIFKVLPDIRLSWSDVWLGAMVTSVLFTAGKFAIGAYLGTTGVASAYGAAGSVVLLLLWVYYSSLIFFFGAELTRSYAHHYGSRRPPAPAEARPVRAG